MDGMRFEFFDKERGLSPTFDSAKKLYESGVYTKPNKAHPTFANCGSMGLAHNPDMTEEPPCLITVDVNGDRKPFPNSFVHYYETDDGYQVYYYHSSKSKRHANPDGRLLTDTFSILITDQGAIPYGVVAQKAMYQAQK